MVTWTGFSILIAEERGITSYNVDRMMKVDGAASRLLGATEEAAQAKMGLPANALYQVAAAIASATSSVDRALNRTRISLANPQTQLFPVR